MERKRKIQYEEDGIWQHSYIVDGGATYNPCGCGSNVYHVNHSAIE